jgi:small-conductance mechanosensitive channel
MTMPEQTGFFTRIGEWFKGGARTGDAADLPLQGQLHDDGDGPPSEHHHPGGSPVVVRSTLFRPWAKRDAAIENLQNGVGALSDLMLSIRDNLEKSSNRQAELLQYLSHLPEALQQLPESSRMQSETLKAIQRRMEQQSDEQSKLAEILDRISQTDQVHGRTLDALHERVGAMNEQDGRIAENLTTVGSALQSVSRNSDATTAVLQQMRDTQTARDGQIEQLLAKQSTRFTTLLVIAIVMSVAAIASVAVVGYQLMQQGLK